MAEAINWHWAPLMAFLLWASVMGIKQDRREYRRKVEAMRPKWKALKAETPGWTKWDWLFLKRYPEPPGKRWNGKEWVKA